MAAWSIYRQPRSARQRARAAHRDVAVPHGRQQRGQPAAPGRRTVLQQLERQVSSRDARLARGALRRVGPAAAARTQHGVLFHAARRCEGAREVARRSRCMVAEDGRPRRAREPEQGESVHHVAAATSYLPCRDALQGTPDARDAGEYRDVVFETAELLATWPFFDRKADRFVLGPPSSRRRKTSSRWKRSIPPSSSSTGVLALPPRRSGGCAWG